jgi:CubicO group peptidase (beta-lactamase class C family)
MSDERAQARVQAEMDRLVASGKETGLQVAVIRNGHTVVEAVSGLADPCTGAPASEGTLFYAASTAKGVATSVAHILAERGEVDYDTRAVDVWPEFGSHGKDKVTLRHVLLQTAGVPGLPPDTTVADLCDWDKICGVLADAEPWWEPGTRFGYHAQTFGFLVGEILRRATGRPISTLLRDLMTGPLEIADEIHFGVPEQLLPRVARQVAPEGPAPTPPVAGSTLERAMPRGIQPDAAYANRADVLVSDIPSAGTMTARGVARMYSALLGHVGGVTLVSPPRLATMATVTYRGMDEVMGFPSEWAFGYSPYRAGGGPSREGSTFGMLGINGSGAFADIDSGVALAVMRNRFDAGDMTTLAQIDRIVLEELS